jgi:hypothetical protein
MKGGKRLVRSWGKTESGKGEVERGEMVFLHWDERRGKVGEVNIPH